MKMQLHSGRAITLSILLLSVAFFSCLAPVRAAETAEQLLQKGNSFYVQQQYTQAHTYWLQAAELGNDVAAYNISVLYERGEGVSQDYKVASSWLQKALAKNNLGAQRNLGVYHRHGWGVDQDYQKAVRLLQQAAERGDSLAAAHLGEMYYDGEGVAQDYGQAEKWLRQSAAAGNAYGQYILGLMYEAGHGVARDEAQAVSLFQLAGQQGIADAQAKVGAAYCLGEAGLAKNKAEGLKWLTPAAQGGSVDAQGILGAYYLGAFGDPQELDKSVAWLVKAGMNNHQQSMLDLGAMVMKGMVPQARYPEVKAVMNNWANKDNTSAQIYLATMYEKGLGIKVNKVQAHAWYSLALAKMKAPIDEGEDLMFTAFTGGVTPTYTSVKGALATLETVMTPDELQQAKNEAAGFRRDHGNAGK